MSATQGFHYVKSCYGLWLPGDERGSWSERWDEQIGFTEPHMLHPGDPTRLRMAEERMKHCPVVLDGMMSASVERTIGRCAGASPWKVVAGAIEPTHIHLLITATSLDIDRTLKWLAQQMTKAIHRETAHKGPVWSEGKWCSVIYDNDVWINAVNYIENHNVRHGLGRRPFSHIVGWY